MKRQKVIAYLISGGLLFAGTFFMQLRFLYNGYFYTLERLMGVEFLIITIIYHASIVVSIMLMYQVFQIYKIQNQAIQEKITDEMAAITAFISTNRKRISPLITLSYWASGLFLIRAAPSVLMLLGFLIGEGMIIEYETIISIALLQVIFSIIQIQIANELSKIKKTLP